MISHRFELLMRELNGIWRLTGMDVCYEEGQSDSFSIIPTSMTPPPPQAVCTVVSNDHTTSAHSLPSNCGL